jgi:hypothetical protein
MGSATFPHYLSKTLPVIGEFIAAVGIKKP